MRGKRLLWPPDRMGLNHVDACQPDGVRYFPAAAATLEVSLLPSRECSVAKRSLRYGHYAFGLWICWRGELHLAYTGAFPSVLTKLQIPAMNYLLEPSEQGPIYLNVWQLIVWSLGLCYFGVVFAVPL